MSAPSAWVAIVWDGEHLFAVAGPFPSRLAAVAWCDQRAPEKRDVVPLWAPEDVEETQSAAQTG